LPATPTGNQSTQQPEIGLQGFVTGIISLMCMQYECKCVCMCVGNEETKEQALKFWPVLIASTIPKALFPDAQLRNVWLL